MLYRVFFILIPIVFVTAIRLNSQPNWVFTNTGSNHTILIQNSISISIDGIQIVPGDYLGVFYDSLGILTCGGYMEWQGNTSTLAAWGAQTGNNDGFATGEEFVWKIWRASDQYEFTATAEYLTAMFPNQGSFSVNGMSGLASLTATSPEPPSPDWNFQATPLQHIIIIPDTISILLNSNPIVTDDYIGVFYDSLGTYVCGGYLRWTGTIDTLIAYGQTTGNNGFTSGEEFQWRLWRASSGFEAWANASYDTQSFGDSSLFVSGGQSLLTDLNAVSGKDLGISALLWPQNSCNSLSTLEPIEIEFFNFGNGSSFNFLLSVNINENWFDTTFQVSTTIPSDSSLAILFPLNMDLSDTGSYSLKLSINLLGDIITQNDSLNQIISNFPLPELEIHGLDTTHCQSNNTQIELTGWPTGGYFSGNNILNNIFYPATTGATLVQYHYTDPATGCSSFIGQNVEVLESPQIDLGPDQVGCEGDTIVIEVPQGFITYEWSNGLGNSFQVIVSTSGDYSVTVSSENSCTATDEINISFNPSPFVLIQGDTGACVGDSILLDAGFGFDFYTWQTTPPIYSQQIYVHESQSIEIIVSLNGCSASDSFQVDFYPLPEIEIAGKDSACEGEVVKLDAGPGYGFYQWSNSINNWGQTNNVFQTGYYSVVVTGPNNCQGSDTIHVQFFPYPEIGFEPLPLLCEGDTVTLAPGKADKYMWSTGETSDEITVTKTGKYFLTVTSNNCSVSDDITLTFFTIPQLSFSYDKLFHRVTFINTSSIESNYRWLFGDGNDSHLFEPTHFYSDTGAYIVQLESINECGYFSVSEKITVSDVDYGHSFKKPGYFPNPGNGIFNISFSLYENVDLSFSVYNSQGCQVFNSPLSTYPIGENLFMLDLSKESPGIYYIEWSSVAGKFSDKLVIVKDNH